MSFKFLITALALLFAHARLSGQCTITLTSSAGSDAQTVCVNSPVANITYATAFATGATVTVLPAGSGLSGTWSANVVTISGTAADTGTFTYTVTLLGSCGTAPPLATGTIVVKAIPNVVQPVSLTACKGATTSAINFAGAVPGTVFNWTNTNPAIGLAAAGSGNIAAFTATNPTTGPITATVSVTPVVSGGYAYIPNSGANNVSVINTATNALVDSIAVGSSPHAVTVSPNGGLVYVANSGSNNVSVINASTRTVIATIPVGIFPWGITISPDGSRVYVANEVSNTVFVINTATNAVMDSVTVGLNPFGLSVTPDGSRVYVTNINANTVSAIDAATRTVIATIPVGSAPEGIVVSPDGSTVYVANENSNFISVISTATNTVSTTVSAGTGPWGVAVSPDGSRLYVTNYYSNNVTVINTATNAVAGIIPVGFYPLGVSVSPDGSRVYVANRVSQNVSVISTATNAVVAVVPVGAYPYSLGNFVAGGTTCSGTPKSFTITVNPKPDALAAPLSQAVCSGDTFSTISLSGGIAGTNFTWTRNNITAVTGTPTSGSGNIAGTLINNTAAQVTVTFTITPDFNGCQGTPVTATVLVRPRPDAQTTSISQAVCSGTPIAPVILTGSVPGTTFTWTRNNAATVIGIGNGAGNINGALINLTDTPVTVSFNITPGANGCTGTAIQHTVVVKPRPNVVATPAAQMTCSGAAMTTIMLTSNVSGTTYAWTRDHTDSVSGPGPGTAATISGTLTNNSSAPKTVTFTINSLADGCPGVPVTATDSVIFGAPISLVSGSDIQTHCVDTPITPIVYAAPGATSAIFSNLPAGVTGSWSAGMATISGIPVVPGIFQYTVTPTGGCSSIPASGIITVTANGSLTLDRGANIQTLCVNTPVDTIRYTVGGSGSAGSVSGLPGGVGWSVSGSRITISGMATDTGTFHYTVHTSGPCVAPIATGTIRVITSNTIARTSAAGTDSQSRCINDFITDITYATTGATGATFSGLPPGISGTWANDLVSISGSATVSGTFGYTVNLTGGCGTVRDSGTITVYPEPTLIVTPAAQTACSGSSIDTIRLSGNVGGTVFRWKRDKGTLSTGPVSGLDTSGQGDITGTLTQSGKSPVTVTFRISPTANGCTGNVQTATVVVSPVPQVTVTPHSQAICSGSAIEKIVTRGDSVAGAVYTWSRDNTGTVTAVNMGINGSILTNEGTITGALTNNTNVPIWVSFVVMPAFTLAGTGKTCTGKADTAWVKVNTNPVRPKFRSLSLFGDADTLRVCQGGRNINFNVAAPVYGITYLWSAVPANTALSIKDPGVPNTVISFPDAGTYKIRVHAQNDSTACADSVFQTVIVSSAPGMDTRPIIGKQPGNLLIYPDNAMDIDSGYQWGYDSLMHPPTGALLSGVPVPLSGQVYQTFVPDARLLDLNNQLDTFTRAFWVQLKKQGCLSRVYYNGPFARSKMAPALPEDNTVRLRVIPNPNNGNCHVSLEGAIYGRMQATVYNGLGQAVFRSGFAKTAPGRSEAFDVSGLPDGMYYLTITSSDLQKVQTRFIIQR